VSVFEESGFRFDFAKADKSVIHDKTTAENDGNTIWPGIDFRIFEQKRQVWVEVKSWSFKKIVDKAERHHASRDYRIKMGADGFRDDILAKFLGTTSYLVWSNRGIPSKVLFVVFLEPPNRGSRALLLPFQDRLRDTFKNLRQQPWGGRIGYVVVDMQAFMSVLPDYPVVRL